MKKWPSAKTAFEWGLKGAFFTQRFEPSNIAVFEQILARTMRSAQLRNASARKLSQDVPSLTLFEVARLGRKGEAFWPKAYLHCSLRHRPRNVMRLEIVWPKAIFT